MKGKKQSAEQIIKRLREADAMLAAGKSIGQACQALEISEQTFHRWPTRHLTRRTVCTMPLSMSFHSFFG